MFELIRILRMPLAFLVVLIHVSVPESWSTQAEQGAIQFFRFFFLCPLAVPLFFLFFGFLFFRERELTRADYVRKLKSRVRTLLIPYLLFSLIGAGYIWGVKSFGFSRAAENPYNEIHNLWDFFVFICKDGGGIGPLWFLRHLFLVSLLSPLICFLIKKIGVLFVLLLFSWMATDGGSIYSVSLFFWSAGAFIALSSTATRVINCSFLPLLILYPISAAADYAFADVAPWLHALNLAFGAMFAVSSRSNVAESFREQALSPDFCASGRFLFCLSDALFFSRTRHSHLRYDFPSGRRPYRLLCNKGGVFLFCAIAFLLLNRHAPNVLKALMGKS